MTDTVDRFLALFRGRGDAHGSWQGGAVREPVTRQHFHNHLHHGPHIGSYPLLGTTCSWGCVDIDGKDWDHNWETMWTIAHNLQTVLNVKSIPAHCERTAHGIHVWIFPEDPVVEAAFMRRALMAACTAIGYTPKEVNPKQEAVIGAGLGNYVRLPYPAAMVKGGMTDERFFVLDGEPLGLYDFLDHAEHAKASTDALEAVSRLWTPPVTRVAVDVNAGLDVEPLVKKLPGLAYTVWRDGPLPGADRSGTLIRFAHMLNDGGFAVDEAFQLLVSADLRWGKFADRPDRDEQLTKILERAYQ